MTIFTPGFILLCVIGAVTYLFAIPTTKRVEKAREALSSDDLKTFGERYRSRAKRRDMPARFNTFAQASDRASRIWMISAAAIIVTLAAILFLSPNLGLPIGGTP